MIPALVVAALAAYRATRLVVTDSIFDRPRNWVFTHAPAKIGEFVDCPHCVGVWAAGAAAAVVLGAPDLGPKILSPLAVAGAVSLLASWDGR